MYPNSWLETERYELEGLCLMVPYDWDHTAGVWAAVGVRVVEG